MDALMLSLNWQRVRLGDILSYEQPTKYLVATTQYLQKGFTPILTAGKTFILGYTNDKHGIYTNIPVIIFDDFTTDSKMVNFPFKVKSSAIKILSLRDNNQADLKYIYEKLTLLKHQVTDHKRYWIDEFSNFEILLPPLNEQIAIANILSDVDHYLYSLDALILKKESVKKALRIKMLNQILASNGVEFRKLGDIGEYIRGVTYKKNQEINNLECGIKVLRANNITLSNHLNFEDIKVINKNVKIRKEQYLKKNDILICAGNGSSEHIGKVTFINTDFDYVFGGFMGVIRIREVNSRFVYYIFTSNIFKQYLEKSLNTTTINNLNANILQNFLIPLPPLNEQIAIANILSALDNEITSLKNKKRQFENIKKALNHDLMSAKIRVLEK
ncbi:restriction endonuclease subunit S [Helicobacter pylori]|uniref:restriction endonuclease subunit S n=1 Tax=Helicobacter pylori TaxID=210 RepID=UPI001EEDA4A6|nr:restriction endonuclease subunit S [Helicobacter pylori]